MTKRTRAWLIDLISAFVNGLIVIVLVSLAGGPQWAAIGFGLVVYYGRPSVQQEKERLLVEIAEIRGHLGGWGKR